jgi:opacity protein-like surface antigen
MKFDKAFMTMMLGTALAVAPAFAQEEADQSQEVTVLALGSFEKNTTHKGIEQSTSNSAGVLANYRYFFNRNNGVEANYAFTSNTQNYGAIGSLAAIDSRSHEVSAAYVLRFPGKWISPFAMAGAGGLMFNPKNFTGASTQARAAFVYGAGADINMSKRLFMRAEYRGLVYNSPNFGIPGLAGTDRLTHKAEPTVGFGFRF